MYCTIVWELPLASCVFDLLDFSARERKIVGTSEVAEQKAIRKLTDHWNTGGKTYTQEYVKLFEYLVFLGQVG